MIKKYLALTISEITHDETTHDWLEIFSNDDILPQIKIYLSPVDDTRLAGTCRDIRLVPKVQKTTDHINTIKRAMSNSSIPYPTELIFKYRPFAKGDFNDQLDRCIQTYITETLQTEKTSLFEKLEEVPGHTEQQKAAHTQDIRTRITDHPLLVFATVTDIKYKGATPLHVAALHGQTAIAILLMDKGAEVKATNETGWTPLHWAARNGHAEIVQALITAGTQVKATTNIGNTPLHWAARNGHTKIAQELITAGAQVNATITAGYYKGWTPLHWAARNGHIKAAELLLKAGAEVKAREGGGYTPLQWTNNDTIEALLRNAGAKNHSCCTIL